MVRVVSSGLVASWELSARVKKSRSGSLKEKTSTTSGSSSPFKRCEETAVLERDKARDVPDNSHQGWDRDNAGQACSLLDKGQDRANNFAGRNNKRTDHSKTRPAKIELKYPSTRVLEYLST